MPWAPTGVPGLLISLDAKSLPEDYPEKLDGEGIPVWPDGSGVAGDAISALSGGANTSLDLTDPDRPAIELSGTSSGRFLLPVDIFDGLTGANGGEVFAIVKAAHPHTSRKGFWYLWDANFATNMPWDGRIYDAAFSANRNLDFDVPGDLNDAPHFINEYGKTGPKGIRWDGVEVASNASNVFSVNQSPVQPWIGASESYTTSTQQWGGFWYAFIAFDHVLTPAERDEVYRQLADRWLLSVALDNGSTYVGVAPPDPGAEPDIVVEISIVDDRGGPIVSHVPPAGAADMQFEILEGFYDPSRTLFLSEWLPVDSPIVLAAGTFAPGWRNLFRIRYRDDAEEPLGLSQAEELFPAWAHPPALPLPPRNTQAEFETPGVTFEGTSSTRRPDALSWSYRTAHTVGPRAFSDPSAGFLDRPWRIRYADDGNVYLRRANDAGDAWEAETLLFAPGVEIFEIDLAFDQNGRPIACAEVDGLAGPEVWLYWPNPTAGGALIFEKIADGRNPRLLLDDPEGTLADSDVLLFYMSDALDHLCYRVQRELYATEHLHPLTNVANYFLEDVALAQNFRLQIIGSVRDPATGNYALAVTESAPYALRPNAPIDVSDMVLSTEIVDVLIVFEADEPLDASSAVLSIEKPELVLIQSMGPESFDASSALLSTAIEDTVLKFTSGAAPEEGIDPSSAVLSSAVTEYVIDTIPLDDAEIDASSAVLSLTLAPV
jgi:hypothetical protein